VRRMIHDAQFTMHDSRCTIHDAQFTMIAENGIQLITKSRNL